MVKTRDKILILLLSFLSGVFLAPDFVYLIKIIYIVILPALLLFIFVKNDYVKIVSLVLVGLCLGVLLYNFWNNRNEVDRKNYVDGLTYSFSGYIVTYPQEKDKSTTFVLESDEQKVYIASSKLNHYKYGQRIKVVGEVNKIENEDTFNFKDYFLSKKIAYQMFYPKIVIENGTGGNFITGKLFQIRKSFEDKTNEIFVKPYSSFILGILLGVKSLSNDLMDMFSKVSLSHIIVVSGYNLSIIAEALKKVLYPASRKLSFWLPILGIWIFTFLVGADAPVVRAAIMASVIVFSRKSGKKADGVALVTLAATSMVIINPTVLRYDPGFQLSFLSTLGIVLYCEKIEHLVSLIKLPKFITEIISATLAAQILIIPVIALYFGRVSILGPIANFIVLPLIPIIMLSSFVTIIIGFLNMGLAQILSAISVLLILFCIKIGQFLSNFKFTSLEIKFNFTFVLLYFVVLIILNYIYRIVKNKKV